MNIYHFLFVIYLEINNFRGTAAFKTTSRFKNVKENKNKYPTVNVLQEFLGTVSVSRCMTSCLRYSACLSVFYNKDNQSCVCTGQVETSDLTPSPGYVQFSINQSDNSDWITFGNSQYLILQRHRSWTEAQVECATFGARLAEIENMEENVFLQSLTRTSIQDSIFLGGIDVFEEGSWIWYSTLKTIDFTDWAPSKPDYGGPDHCLSLHPSSDYAWDDEACGCKLDNILCERVVV